MNASNEQETLILLVKNIFKIIIFYIQMNKIFDSLKKKNIKSLNELANEKFLKELLLEM